jgi:hypothetical protein
MASRGNDDDYGNTDESCGGPITWNGNMFLAISLNNDANVLSYFRVISFLFA